MGTLEKVFKDKEKEIELLRTKVEKQNEVISDMEIKMEDKCLRLENLERKLENIVVDK